MNYIVICIIPIIVISVSLYGFIKGVKVYECFVDGAKEGINICVRIFPYILAMLVAVSVFKYSGALEYITYIFSPILKLMGIPKELMLLIFIKPLSGSGALGIFTDVIKTYGADTNIGIAASIIMGTTETIFYTITVYYGAVKVKNIRHTLIAAVIADITAIIAAVNITVFIKNI
ncbi:spore maturation protein [Clostridium oryzae]|uniref:Spore maturation protein B n=1 Tax=Clostridium oryzae TaxID=1450648 RepID=A0A1V4IN83_9CLOT|nr:nucleoside recognition domain-containing protein [Clostridium oryzae]OPJ61309.1 spore maturation protein B [Clostridium oryzae]